MTKTRVVILFGGRSTEHEISLLSARNVVAALDRDRFEPVLVGIDRAGRWHREDERTLAAMANDPRLVGVDAAAPLAPVHPYPAPSTELAAVIRPDDVVFPVLHGTYGEDGTVQGLLELSDVAYVGPGVLGSAIGMDKDVTKRLLRDAGLPIVDFRLVTARDLANGTGWREAGTALGYPLFVKPANAGSSVGVHKVQRPAELEAALRDALSYDRKALLERAVSAREIECAVLGNAEPQASVPGEVVVTHRDGFYSYQAKYLDAEGAAIRIPADVPPAVAERVRALAVAAFRVLELSGMARVDFFLEQGTDALYLNEVNTIPGFTAVSMYPKMWEASGLPPKALMSRLIDLALERRRERRALRTDARPTTDAP